MYIEPCCIDHQLPKFLRDGGRFFQTSGDITMRHFLDAVSYMCGNELELTLVVPAFDGISLHTFNHYFNRGWLKSLSLLTAVDQSDLLTEMLDPGILANTTYAFDPLVADNLLYIHGSDNSVIIQGAMLSRPVFLLTLYAAYLGRDTDVIESVMSPIESKFRIKPIELTKKV